MQNQLISVGWLGTGFMSGAELVKEVFQSGALNCAGLLPQVFKKRHPFLLHYTHVRAFYALVAPEESLMCNPCHECKKFACKSLYKVTGVTGKSRAGYYTLFLGETRDKGNDGRLAEIVWLEDLRSNGKRTG